MQVDVVIIGAGIVGLATGLELVTRYPNLSLAILDKEDGVGKHQTGHNSGVIHSGIYYKPGSLKAKLCVEGAKAMVRFCIEHGIAHKICGKIIVATTEEELTRLDDLFYRGNANGLQGLRMLIPEQIQELEPYSSGIKGIHVPETGIVDYAEVAKTYRQIIEQKGGIVFLSHEVESLTNDASNTIVVTNHREIRAKLVINCAGLHSDRIRQMTDTKLDLSIIPFRGEYYDISPKKQHCLKGLIYPVPDPKFPFLGVHFTRRISGGIEAGPNAVLALCREGYGKSSMNVQDVFSFLSFPGFWRMASKHWRMSLDEYQRSFSKTAFLRSLQRLMPSLELDDLVPGGSGVRAQAVGRDGKLIDDFHIVYAKRMVHVCNVPSPAATASLSIGKYIVGNLLKEHLSQYVQC